MKCHFCCQLLNERFCLRSPFCCHPLNFFKCCLQLPEMYQPLPPEVAKAENKRNLKKSSKKLCGYISITCQVFVKTKWEANSKTESFASATTSPLPPIPISNPTTSNEYFLIDELKRNENFENLVSETRQMGCDQKRSRFQTINYNQVQ